MHDALVGPIAIFLYIQDNIAQAVGDNIGTSKLPAKLNPSCYVITVRGSPQSSVMGTFCVFCATKINLKKKDRVGQ
jgi:hypothetical protein